MKHGRHDTPENPHTLIDVDEVDCVMKDACRLVPTERVSLSDACGRILREEIRCDRELAALAGADGFLEFPAAQERFPAGFVARLHRFGEGL